MSRTSRPPAATAIVIGAGPVGLATAAHLLERGIHPTVVESGPHIASAVRSWGHIRMFSPWRYNLDAASVRLLEKTGWSSPDLDALPTGAELVGLYLEPLAEELSAYVRLGSTVEAVSRQGMDKSRTIGREGRPYLVRVSTANGAVTDIAADAVIDTSGNWNQPNPMGSAGLLAPGEVESAAYVAGPLPDVLGQDRKRFAGKHTLVVGMGHSAVNSLLNLAALAEAEPETTITWAVRSASVRRAYGGGAADALPARGALGDRLRKLVESDSVRLIRTFTVDKIVGAAGGPSAGPATVYGHTLEAEHKLDVDVIVNATGFRPQLDFLREVRLSLDPAVEAPVALAQMIDPNFHSCGTVPAHGEKELAHPDDGFYLAGSKSYGRAPTFLLATGYEQVRSIAASLAGDQAAADQVRLSLPETGVCSTDLVENQAGASLGLTTGVLHGYSADEDVQDPAEDAPATTGCCG
ncbi:FAD-dependent oxidoreductase [Natronoglycomyces albus]|uniref:FAD-dependent oxidoreductase n=1 Tax=Natronoglycomyces albus TaxID=2811108 RepID=A0A895XTU6_9ACTN|nr:FAD-dependent oxidoreductase [Natronoglycomyces albus]QSB06745.1 FAD-dependent oxidoreductase [Natronoglycomyces albus]